MSWYALVSPAPSLSPFFFFIHKKGRVRPDIPPSQKKHSNVHLFNIASPKIWDLMKKKKCLWKFMSENKN